MAIEINPLPMPAGDLSVTVTDVAGIPSPNVIRSGDTVRVKVDWYMQGALVPMLAGNWKVSVFLESLGPGPEIPVNGAPATVAFSAFTLGPGTRRNYSHTFTIGPNFPTPSQSAGASGVYKLVAVLTCEALDGSAGPIAGFIESTILQFYP